MRQSVIIIVLMFSAVGCAATGAPTPELSAFRFEGRPIHPAIIEAFIPWLSDGEPVIAAVDLEGFTRSSNRLCGWTVIQGETYVQGDRPGHGGYLAYLHLGIGENGNHLLKVLDCGGGSSVWRFRMELRFEVVHAFNSSRILLRCVNVEDL